MYLALVKGAHFLYLLMLLSTTLAAQRGDLFVFDLTNDGQSYHLENPRYLSSFNEGGYTNQPHFVDPYRILVSVGKKMNPVETDIYEVNLRSKEIMQVTQTIDREYSPTISRDGSSFRCVLVDVENDNRQILWEYPMDRSHGGAPFVSEAKDVGYYADLGNEVAVFEVGTPTKLFLYDKVTGRRRFISNQIGRSLRRTPRGTLAYLHKFSDAYWYIKEYNLDSGRSEIIKKSLPESEDFEVLSDGSYLMASRGKLYRLDPAATKEWLEIGDFSPYKIGKITRMAYNGINQLAVITTPTN